MSRVFDPDPDEVPGLSGRAGSRRAPGGARARLGNDDAPSAAQLRILRRAADPSLPWKPGGGYFEALAACERRGWLLREELGAYSYRHILSAAGEEVLRHLGADAAPVGGE